MVSFIIYPVWINLPKFMCLNDNIFNARIAELETKVDNYVKLHSIAETAMKNGNSKFNAILAVV